MTLQRADEARIARARSGRLVSVATLAFLAPLMLSACVSDRDKLASAPEALSPTPDVQTSEAAGGTPKPEVVQIASADSGPSRVIVPSGKPPSKPVLLAEGKGARVVADKAERSPTQSPDKSLSSRAANTAVAAREAAQDGVIAAKDTVVAHAKKVGSGAAAIASVSASTMQNVAQAAIDTITGDPKIDRLIAEAADENDIPRELAYAVVRVESHYNPKARGSGVYGLSQIKPATARGMGFSGPTERLLDPETNLRYGMRYLKGAWEKGGGDVCKTAMKYKGGHRTTTMSKSASVYCSNVKRHMAAIRARKTPAMSGTQTLVAAVEPTVRSGVIARTLASKPSPAKPQSETQALPGVPTVAALNGTVSRQGAADAVAQTGAAPVPTERPVDVAENSSGKAVAAHRGSSSEIVGGRVVHSASKPDANRFGGTFDATAPASDGTPSGGLGFN